MLERSTTAPNVHHIILYQVQTSALKPVALISPTSFRETVVPASAAGHPLVCSARCCKPGKDQLLNSLLLLIAWSFMYEKINLLGLTCVKTSQTSQVCGKKVKPRLLHCPLVLGSSIAQASPPNCYRLSEISRWRLLRSTCMELIMVLSANTVAESLSVDWLSKVPCVSISNTATWWGKTE